MSMVLQYEEAKQVSIMEDSTHEHVVARHKLSLSREASPSHSEASYDRCETTEKVYQTEASWKQLQRDRIWEDAVVVQAPSREFVISVLIVLLLRLGPWVLVLSHCR